MEHKWSISLLPPYVIGQYKHYLKEPFNAMKKNETHNLAKLSNVIVFAK